MDAGKPSQELVRSLTDEHVLRTLMRHRRLTRAELATATGISKPTAIESVRRLTERGLVADTGERTPGGRGRGRVGSYYALAPTVGVALAVAIAPEGVVAECLDVYGDTVARAVRQINPGRAGTDSTSSGGPTSGGGSTLGGGPTFGGSSSSEGCSASGGGVVSAGGAAAGGGSAAGGRANSGGGAASVAAAAVGAVVVDAVSEAVDAAGQRVRVAVVSAADPVDRATGRLVHLPDAPFLVGDLDPVGLLAPFAAGPVIVDNDVNWAASAEPARVRDFAYLYLGEGLGCAIVSDGEIRRGSSGLAGEIAHLLTAGPGGHTIRFIELFGELGLRRPGSTAIDVDLLLGSTARDLIGPAVAGVIAALVALADPQEIVIGGSWGPALIDDIRAATARLPRHVPVRPTELTTEPALTGARAAALDHLRTLITS